MAVRCVTALAIISLSICQAATAHSGKETNMNAAQSQAQPRGHTHAETKILVHSSDAQPYDQTAGPRLKVVAARLREIDVYFAGCSMSVCFPAASTAFSVNGSVNVVP